MKKGKNGFKIFLISLLGCVIILVGISFIYLSDYYHSNQSLEEYQNVSSLSIEETDSVITIKGESSNGIGIIFYPGGKVEYTAYIPLLEKIASEGYTCFLPKMPGNLAVLDSDKADEIIKENKEIQTWYLAGHSLGGAMASDYVGKHPEEVKGLILLGAYPIADLSKTEVAMLSVVGSLDEVVNRERLKSSKDFAPKNAIYKVIDGGNHAYYGDYGKQKGDGEAKITPEEQLVETTTAIVDFCKNN